VSPVRYELGFYIPEDGTLHSDRCEHLKFDIALTGWAVKTSNLTPGQLSELCLGTANIFYNTTTLYEMMENPLLLPFP
jgi:hypothetical protein